jgi:hypothetical protein
LQADEATIVDIPDEVIMQSLPFQMPTNEGGETPAAKGWITTFFGIADDFKKGAPPAQAAASLQLRGVPLARVAAQLGVADATLWAQGEQQCSVWNARYATHRHSKQPMIVSLTYDHHLLPHAYRLFPVASTPEESLRLSLAMLASLAQSDGAQRHAGFTTSP